MNETLTPPLPKKKKERKNIINIIKTIKDNALKRKMRNNKNYKL